MTPSIRLATPADGPAVAAIYAPFCGPESHVSFEIEPPSADAMAGRIASTLESTPWLVLDAGGIVGGYAYAGPHSARAAYNWSVNVAVYIADGWRGRGVGRALYESLFALLRLQGYVNACAGIVLPNLSSEALHRAAGFEPVGIYRGIGFKCGRWLDTLWVERALVPRPDCPGRIVTRPEAVEMADWAGAMAAGLAHLVDPPGRAVAASVPTGPASPVQDG